MTQGKGKKAEAQIMKLISDLFEQNPDFTGNIQINFFGGGITNINRTESIKAL